MPSRTLLSLGGIITSRQVSVIRRAPHPDPPIHELPTTNYELFYAKQTQFPVPPPSRQLPHPPFRKTNPISAPTPRPHPHYYETNPIAPPDTPLFTIHCSPFTILRNEPNPSKAHDQNPRNEPKFPPAHDCTNQKMRNEPNFRPTPQSTNYQPPTTNYFMRNKPNPSPAHDPNAQNKPRPHPPKMQNEPNSRTAGILPAFPPPTAQNKPNYFATSPLLPFSTTPLLHFSTTPLLHYSTSPLLPLPSPIPRNKPNCRPAAPIYNPQYTIYNPELLHE